MRFPSSLPLAGLIALLSLPAGAATTYVASQSSKVACAKPDGSLKCPWTSVTQALGRAKGGDTILLQDGNHGGLDLNRFKFKTPVTIRSQSEKNARIKFAHFGAETRNITLSNLSIWRDEGDWAGFLIRAYRGSSRLVFDGLDIRSRKNSQDYLRWSKSRWKATASNAVDLQGSNYTLTNNKITGVGRGIVAGKNSRIEGNVIDGFVWDGIRGSSNSIVRGNVVKNSLRIDNVHRDGFQAYASGGVSDLTVEGNTFIEWAYARDHSLRGWMQGISLFDGFYDNLLIRENVVATRHTNGIAINGTRNAKVLNNTVVSLNGSPSKYPMIRVKPHKDGRPSKAVLVANNLAMGFDGSVNVVLKSNGVIVDPSSIFLDPANFDYRLKPNSGLKGKGAIQALNLALSRLALSETAGSAAQSLFRAETVDPLFSGATGRAGEVALAQEDPATVPLPAAGFGLLAALGALLTLRRRTARA
jgi:hypothetical protein